MKKNSKFIAIIVALLLVAGGTAYSMKSIEPIEEPTIAETQETTETPTETIPVAKESVESAPSTEVTEEVPVVEETPSEQGVCLLKDISHIPVLLAYMLLYFPQLLSSSDNISHLHISYLLGQFDIHFP